jgi:K+-sensing histidine kinase KdpD
MSQAIERIGKVLRELREFYFPAEHLRSTKNLAGVVEEAVQKGAQGWKDSERRTRTICHAPLATFSLDWVQISRVLERIVSCAHVLLPSEGGEVVVEAGIRAVGPQQYVDLRVRSIGVVPLQVEEQMLFQPFVRVNGHALGLSLLLTQGAVYRLHGQVFFHRISPRQSCFTLLFRV